MTDRLLVSRREAGKLAFGLASAVILGCQSRKPVAPKSATTNFGWNAIASESDGPGPRSRHGLVYDSRTKATVLFGGIIWAGRGSFESDTWELRSDGWSKIKTRSEPPARHRGAMVYDPVRGNSVLFGGQGRKLELLGDTWTYANCQWVRWNPDSNRRPMDRAGHCMAFDEPTGMVVLFGGIDKNDHSLNDTWLFDGKSWQQVTGSGPERRRYSAFAYDPELRGCLLHGGSADDAGTVGFGDAWLFRNASWERLPNTLDTENRDDHGLAYHRSAKRLVMLEGVAGARGLLVREGFNWKKVDVTPLHPRHQCSPLAWDDGLDGLVFHGGEVHHKGPQFDTTWLLRLPDLSQTKRGA